MVTLIAHEIDFQFVTFSNNNINNIHLTATVVSDSYSEIIAECSILLDIDVELSEVYKKFLVTK